jgi:hypothetical protein
MATIYSTRFIAVKGGTTLHTYTVPAGFVAVIRDVDTYASSEFSAAQVFLEGHLGQALWAWTAGLGQESYGSWRGRQVINAGETFGLRFNISEADGTCSGYLLTLP